MKICSKMILGLTIIFSVFLFVIVVLSDENELPGFMVTIRELPFGDKVGHFALMGFLAFLANLSWHGARFKIGSVPILKGSLIVLIVVTLEEFSQIYFPSRTFSLWDLLADYVGIFLFGQAALFLIHKRIKAECHTPL